MTTLFRKMERKNAQVEDVLNAKILFVNYVRRDFVLNVKIENALNLEVNHLMNPLK